MKPILPILFLALILFSPAESHEFSGEISAEARVFVNDAVQPGQKDRSSSLKFEGEYNHKFEGGSVVNVVPFFRQDSADSRRTHFDLREMNFVWVEDAFELRMGVGKVFWGVAEFQHLVDVINQTDLVENLDFEDKLGQPMVNLSLARDWGTVDLFLLPYFRERTFPGEGGRLRFGQVVDTANPVFESGARQWRQDWAVRYSHFVGDWDFGLYHFMGTNRDPSFLRGTDAEGKPTILPFYETINQTGLDVSLVQGSWLWKLEGLHRAGQGDKDYVAWTGGFEYTFFGIFDSGLDLGVLGEWLYDDRGSFALTPFENDVGTGLRLAFNDVQSTEFLLGWVQDVASPARLVFIEFSRRFGEHFKLNIETRLFLSQPKNDFLFSVRDDDLIQLEIEYHF